MSCAITVRLHGPLVGHAGARELSLLLTAGARVGDVWSALTHVAPRAAALRAQCALAVNDAWADPSAALRNGDVVDVIPPVSGG